MQNIIMSVNTVTERQDLTDIEDVEPLYQLLQKQFPTEKLKKKHEMLS